jgi:Xaa-Pro dipeptidase
MVSGAGKIESDPAQRLMMPEGEDSMHQDRLNRLHDLQVKAALDCVALMPGANLRYLTGLQVRPGERPYLAFFPVEGQPAFVLPALEATQAQERLPSDVQIFAYSDEEGHEHAFEEAADALQLANRRVAVEFTKMRVMELRRLERAAPGVQILASEPWLGSLRAIKDATEVDAMRRAIEIAEAALQDILPEIRPGRTELEIAADLQIALLRRGGEGLPFAPIVVSGPNSALPHAHASTRALQRGDLLTIDWGTTVDGYASDITRTFAIGPLSDDLAQVYDVVLAANQAGRLAARAGTTADAVDRATREVIARAGYGAYFVHRTGHGLGLEGHEPPFIVAGNLEQLRSGVTCTIEPGIYLPGVGGVRIEDDVVVTDRGAESLTSLPRELKHLE